MAKADLLRTMQAARSAASTIMYSPVSSEREIEQARQAYNDIDQAIGRYLGVSKMFLETAR